MKKFTDVVCNTTEQLPKNEQIKANQLSIIDDKVKKLIDSLHIDVEGIEAPWVENVVISESAAFRDVLNDLINTVYFEQKKELLEKAHSAILTRDVTFLAEQLELLSDTKNKK